MDEIVIPSQETTKNLIFLFHGYGSNKEDLFPVGKLFSKAKPSAEIHLINGIDSCPESGGYRWFPLDGNDVGLWGTELLDAEPKIMQLINLVLDEKHLDYKDVIFSGFSQGAMISLSLGIFYNVKAVISFSGLLLYPEYYLKKANTKVLLTHGKDDTVIPAGVLDLTETALKNTSIEVRTAISENLGHAIDDYLLEEAVDFLNSL